jgi:hypothetical protein
MKTAKNKQSHGSKNGLAPPKKRVNAVTNISVN